MSFQTLLLPVLIPLILAVFILPFFRKNAKAATGLVLASVLISGAAFIIARSSGSVVDLPWVDAFKISFSLTSWKTFLLGFVFLFQFLTAVYSFGAASRLEKPYLYSLALLIAFASACSVIMTDNLLVLLVGWELFLVALYLMILSGGKQAEAAANKALMIGGASDFLMILGLMFFFHMAPADPMHAQIALDGNPMAFWSFFLIFLGAGAKAGMFPFHTWIPDAAQVMPASGFAAMPASLEKVLGIYFLYIVTNQMFVLNPLAHKVMFFFGIATVFVTIAPAMVEKDLRRILALTAISPVGFMVCGMAVSEAAGFAGALLYMLTHATYKSAMFFAAGNFEAQAGSSQLENLLGAARRMPLTAIGFFLAFLAAISLPPTGGFIAKELILEGALESGHIVILILLVIGAILNISVFAKVVAVLWAKDSRFSGNDSRGVCAFCAFLMGIVALFGGAIFQRADGLLGAVVGAHEEGLVGNVWHFSTLTIVSLAIYTLGFAIYAAARSGRANAAETFSTLTASPVLGPALRMAEAKKFDVYEIGVKVIDFITRVVFRYVERMVDVAGNGVIGIGRWLLQPMLSGAHNGIYGNYLGWSVAGFILILIFLIGGAA